MMMILARRIGLAVAVLGLVGGLSGRGEAGVAYRFQADADTRVIDGTTYNFEAIDFSMEVAEILPAGTNLVLSPPLEVSGRSFDQLQVFGVVHPINIPQGFAFTQSGLTLDGVATGELTSMTFQFDGGATGEGTFTATNFYRNIKLSNGGTGAFGANARLTISEADTPAVPEPATFATAGLGVLAGLGYAWRHRRAA